MSTDAMVIDGSGGEGGGQMLRTSLALSAVTGKAFRMENIRANRPKPGLARQHLAGLELMGCICNARIRGGHVGSASLEFIPGEIRHGDYSAKAGTAGSITLVLQAVLPALAWVRGSSTIELRGGTDVRWSPPADYCSLVLFPILERCGLSCSLEVHGRGYYPKGGGSALAVIESKANLSPVEPGSPSGETEITGKINITGLPPGIAHRVRDGALQQLPQGLRDMAQIAIDRREAGPSQGVGLTLSAARGGVILGADSLGERGKRAEQVGREAAEQLMAELDSGAGVDLRASDQLMPFLALAGGEYTARELTGHARTNMEIIGRFLGDCMRSEGAAPVRFLGIKK